MESLLKFDLSPLTYDRSLKQHSIQLQLYTGEHCDFASNPHSTQLGLIQVALASNEMTVGGTTEVETTTWEWNEESVTWFNAPLRMEGGGKMARSLGGLEKWSWWEIGT